MGRLLEIVILITSINISFSFLFGDLFGGACQCSQQCGATAPTQPCQMFCPQQTSCGQGGGSAYAAPSFSPPLPPSYPSPSAYPTFPSSPSWPSFPPGGYSPPAAPAFPPSGMLMQPLAPGQQEYVLPPNGQPLPSMQPPQRTYAPSIQRNDPPQYQPQSQNLIPASQNSNGGYQEESIQPIPPPESDIDDSSSSIHTPSTLYPELVPPTRIEPSYTDAPDSFTSNPSPQTYGMNSNEFRIPVDNPNPEQSYQDPAVTSKRPRETGLSALSHEHQTVYRPPLPSVLTRGEGNSSQEKFDLALKRAVPEDYDGENELRKHAPSPRSAFGSSEVNTGKLSEGISIPKGEKSKSLRMRGEGKLRKFNRKLERMKEAFDIYDDIVGTGTETATSREHQNSARTVPTFEKRESEPVPPPPQRKAKVKKGGVVKCNSEKLRRIMQERMSFSPSTSKQMVYSGVREAYGGRSPDVICSRASFSYIVVTSQTYCEHRKAPVTCFVYFQP